MKLIKVKKPKNNLEFDHSSLFRIGCNIIQGYYDVNNDYYEKMTNDNGTVKWFKLVENGD